MAPAAVMPESTRASTPRYARSSSTVAHSTTSQESSSGAPAHSPTACIIAAREPLVSQAPRP